MSECPKSEQCIPCSDFRISDFFPATITAIIERECYNKSRMKKKRLDQVLVEKGVFASRSKAQAAILANLVEVDGKKEIKPGTLIAEDARIKLMQAAHPYVSRGGVKLEKALEVFRPALEGSVALDVGASTGGFTDCLLRHKVKKVYAIDVGYGQLAWELRKDPRVVLLERTNIRYLPREKFLERVGSKSQLPDLAVIDVSFISLSKVLPSVRDLLSEKGRIIALVKPQFEAGKGKVPKGGVIKDKKLHEEILKQVIDEIQNLGFAVLGCCSSPIKGADGNLEVFLYLAP